MKKVVSFLVSGRGSNFMAVAERILAGEINAKLGVLISDKPDAGALDRAKTIGMNAYTVLAKSYTSREEHEREMIRILKDAKTDLVVAAGYMRILTRVFVDTFRNRIINIHPALLPSFPGVHAQQDAYNYGVKISGCTTHFIDEGTDTGPIIMQKAVPVMDNDTISSLSNRILTEEHAILIESVRLFCDDKLSVHGRRVIINV